MDRKRVGILVFDDVEVLDFCGPFEVFSATRFVADSPADVTPFEVVLVAEELRTIAARGGLKVTPDHTFESCPTLDVLVVPGGWGTRREIDNERLIQWVAATASSVETVTSVCTGSLLLAKAGLLEDRRATTHWRAFPWMRSLFPDVTLVEDEHVVTDGRVLTSAGVSAGIDMAILVVARYLGERIARETARTLEYPYPDDNSRRV